MARATPALSSHIIFSQYRGQLAYNDASKDPPPPESGNPGEKGKGGDQGKDPPENSAEARVKGALQKAEEAEKRAQELETKLQQREKADKEAEEKKLAEQGEHQKLAEQYKNESAAEKKAREEADARIKKFEEAATKQVETALAGITDAEKKKSAEALLEGFPPEEQMRRLPEVLKLVGAPAGFGQGTPPNSTQTTEQKNARFEELLAKERKEPLTPPEMKEKHKLMNELSPAMKALAT